MGFRHILAAATFVCAAATAQEPLSDIRSFGAHVADAVAQTEAGTPPTSQEREQLDRELQRLGQSLAIGGSAEPKLHSIARQLMLLDQLTANASSSRTAPMSRAQFALESITSTHGNRCETALGLDVDAPVRFTLAHGADAWLYVARSRAIGLATKSTGPDPALEIFDGCGGHANRLAANDDNVGLDAVVHAESSTGNIYVHVTNAGPAGFIELLASAAPGTINGTVRDATTGQVIVGAQVDAFAQAQFGFYSYGTAYSDSTGTYALTPNMAGTFYLAAIASKHLAQLYPSGYCAYSGYFSYNINTCDFSKAHSVTITATGSVSNINFSLSPGVKLTGQMRATDNTPIQGAVTMVSPSGDPIYTANVDAAGHFEFDTLSPGSYLFKAFANGYSTQLFNHQTCGGPLLQDCNYSAATPVTVGTTPISGINFSLQQLSAFAGTVADQNGTLPQVGIYVLDQNGNVVTSGGTDQSGHYVTGAVPIGNYYLYAATTGYFQQLFDGHDCSGPCALEIASATSLSVTATGQRVEADFMLDRLPSLRGRVTDAISGQPLVNTQIAVTTTPNLTGYSYSGSFTDSDGRFSVSSVNAGSYYVWAIDPTHIDEIYDGIPCEVPEIYYLQPHCDLSKVTLVTIAPGPPPADVDFALSASGSVSGSALMRAGAGTDLPALSTLVTLYDSSETTVAVAYVDAAGHYALTDIPPGTYFAEAMSANSYNSPQYLSQLWQNKDCTACNVVTGTPITIAQGQAIADIDFALTRQDAIVGRVVDPRGVPINGVVIDLFNTSDKSYAGGAASDDNGYFVAQGVMGTSYYVATEAGGDYVDQVYSSIACPSGTAYDGKCSLNGASVINLGNGATQPHIVNFTLQIADRVFE